MDHRSIKITLLLSFIAASFAAQNVCNVNGDLMIFTNYDGGTLTINVNQNIPNLKIGICSYEACNIVLTGAFVSNVVAVRYAGYNSANNNNCSGGTIPTTTITGAPGNASTSIVFAPTSPVTNSYGYGSIICGYSCSNNTNQGGCNTVDQVEGYFLNYFSGSVLFAHKVQYGCWTGTQSVSAGGTCCPPVAVIAGSVTASQTICAGSTPSGLVSYSPASSGTTAVTYTWQSSTTSTSSGFANIAGANSAGYAPSALSTTTYYRRAASTTTNNVVYSNAVTITVNQLPVLSLFYVPNGQYECSGNRIIFSASGASTYTWLPSGVTGGTFSFTSTSNVTITVVGTGANGCTNVAVYPLPVFPSPSMTISSSSSSICAGDTATLTGSGSPGLTYSWYPGYLYGTTVAVSPLVNTTYTVICYNQFCGTRAYLNLVVNPKPTVAISSSADTVCAGKLQTLHATGALNYTWSPGAIAGSSLNITPLTNMTYTVQGVDVNGCKGSASFSMTVLPSPTVVASTPHKTICINESTTLTASGAVGYLWSNGSTSPVISVSPANNTTYTVDGTATNSCVSTASIEIIVNQCVGLHALYTPVSLKVYPNPNKGDFTITSERAAGIDIYDALGNQVKTISLKTENDFHIQVNLPAGIYFAIYKENDSLYTKKIVIVK